MGLIKQLKHTLISLFCVILKRIPRKKSSGTLIVKLEVLGDFLIFLPFLEHYRQNNPREHITLLINHPANLPIAERYRAKGFINEIILLSNRRLSINPLYFLYISYRLYFRHFQKTLHPVYFRRNLGDLLVELTHAHERIGFSGFDHDRHHVPLPENIYTKIVTPPSYKYSEFEKNKLFLEIIFNKKIESYTPSFALDDADVEKAKDILKQHKLMPHHYIIMFPGAGAAYKRWPTEKFAKIADYIAEHQMRVVITGSSSEKKLADDITSLTTSHPLNLSGTTDIFTLAGLIKLSAGYIGNDTGILHLAAGLQVPTLCIMGKGAFGAFFPYGDPSLHKIVYSTTSTCEWDEWECRNTLDPESPAPCIESINITDVQNTASTLFFKHV